MKTSLSMLAVAATLSACAAAPATTPDSNSQNHTAARVVEGTATLRVINTTTDSFAIHLMPDFDPPIPQPAAGVALLRTVGPGKSCIALPGRIDEYLTRIPSGGSKVNPDAPATDTLTWDSSAALALVALDGGGGPSTSWFVPDSSAGWSLTLVAGQSVIQMERASACTP